MRDKERILYLRNGGQIDLQLVDRDWVRDSGRRRLIRLCAVCGRSRSRRWGFDVRCGGWRGLRRGCARTCTKQK